jgi:hypothetical protein
MMERALAVLAMGAAAGVSPAAHGATLSYGAAEAMATTNWTDVLGFSKFDTSLGTLTSIRFDLTGVVQGIGNAESLDASPTSVTLSLGSLLGLTRPDHSTLVVANPVFTQTFDLMAYDGLIDFGGTSGATTGSESASGANFFVSSDAGDLALFSAPGGGSIGLGLSASGNSYGAGSGNLITQFRTGAAGGAQVTYTFTPLATVAEPGSLALVCGGAGLLGAARRRRKG